MWLKAADPTMFEAVSKPELPVTHPVVGKISKVKTYVPLPRISTDCPSKSAGSIHRYNICTQDRKWRRDKELSVLRMT